MLIFCTTSSNICVLLPLKLPQRRSIRVFIKAETGAEVQWSVDSPWPGWWSDPWMWTPAWTETTTDSSAAGPVCLRGKRSVPPVPSPCMSVAEKAWQCCWMLSDTRMEASSNAAGHCCEIPPRGSLLRARDQVKISRVLLGLKACESLLSRTCTQIFPCWSVHRGCVCRSFYCVQ